MSKVISVRLDDSIQAEAEALAALDYLVNQGFTARQVITEALRQLNGLDQSPDPANAAIVAIDQASVRASEVIGQASDFASQALGQTAIELSTQIATMAAQIGALSAQIARLETLGSVAPSARPEVAPDEPKPISDELRASVRRAVRPGKRFD